MQEENYQSKESKKNSIGVLHQTLLWKGPAIGITVNLENVMIRRKTVVFGYTVKEQGVGSNIVVQRHGVNVVRWSSGRT